MRLDLPEAGSGRAEKAVGRHHQRRNQEGEWEVESSEAGEYCSEDTRCQETAKPSPTPAPFSLEERKY
jgi:hypothetical protein